jgi:hypothetical protein
MRLRGCIPSPSLFLVASIALIPLPSASAENPPPAATEPVNGTSPFVSGPSRDSRFGPAGPFRPDDRMVARADGGYPDDNAPPVAAREALSVGEGGAEAPLTSPTHFQYYQVSGATLRGRNSDTGYLYDSSGCSHVTVDTGAGRILNTELPLPDGSIIKFLRVYYRDTNPANGVEGYITRYQPGSGAADLVHTGSSDAFAGGYGFVVSSEISEVVNNTLYAYTLIGWPDAANVANQICGLRVAYYPAAQGTYNPITPCRVLDTRGGAPFVGGAFAAGESRDYDFSSHCGLPPAGSGVLAYSVNVTVTQTAGPGFLSLYPRGSPPVPLTSTINYVAGQTIANGANVPVDATGFLTLICGVSGAHVIVDVNGYYY